MAAIISLLLLLRTLAKNVYNIYIYIYDMICTDMGYPQNKDDLPLCFALWMLYGVTCFLLVVLGMGQNYLTTKTDGFTKFMH